jgi:XRE family transcriptional regulator, fatty acid utilization regulator
MVSGPRFTQNREASSCPDPSCCRVSPQDLSADWADKVVVSARSQDRILGLMAPDPYPELNMTEVLSVVDGHSE